MMPIACCEILACQCAGYLGYNTRYLTNQNRFPKLDPVSISFAVFNFSHPSGGIQWKWMDANNLYTEERLHSSFTCPIQIPAYSAA
ncbi:hypothetical protein FKM82_009956 [Ascaphus truei]